MGNGRKKRQRTQERKGIVSEGVPRGRNQKIKNRHPLSGGAIGGNKSKARGTGNKVP